MSTDAAGNRSAARPTPPSATASPRSDEPEEPESRSSRSRRSRRRTRRQRPGQLQQRGGLPGDWQPDCDQRADDADDDGIWTLTLADLPAGTYEYKVATDKSWDENYGAGGVPNGADIALTHTDGGASRSTSTPARKNIRSTADGPIITLPGSLQSELGCAGDWEPDVPRDLMFDRNARRRLPVHDGRPARPAPTRSRSTHGLSWDENYGAGGAPDGAEHPVHRDRRQGRRRSATTSRRTSSPITGAATRRCRASGSCRRTGSTPTRIAWPADLGGPRRQTLSWQLHASADAALAVADGEVTGGDRDRRSRVIDGGPDRRAEGASSRRSRAIVALRVDGHGSPPAAACKGQLVVAQRDAGGVLTGFTGVQIPGVLDDLYADALADAALGVDVPGQQADLPAVGADRAGRRRC